MAEQGREAEAEEGSRQEGGDEEAEPRTFGGVPNLSFSGQGGTRRDTCYVFVFGTEIVKFYCSQPFSQYILTRGLGPERS